MKHFPEWIRQSNGELVPFDADRINQALFTTMESLKQPNAFLARELTDGVLHFLSVEESGGELHADSIRDIAIKVVRELGHPKLAIHFQRTTASADWLGIPNNAQPSFPADGTTVCFPRTETLRQHTLSQVYTRDLIDADREGFLTICDTAPEKLAGGVARTREPGSDEALSWTNAATSLRQLQHAAAAYGSFVIWDGPEFALQQDDHPTEKAAEFVELLKTAVEVAGLNVLVNLNIDPPDWGSSEVVAGPLFAHGDGDGDRREVFRQALLQVIAQDQTDRGGADWRTSLRVDYHFRSQSRPEYSAVGQFALCEWLRFVVDTVDSAPQLADGLTRSHSGVLSCVAVHLPHLAELDDVANDPDRLLQKIPSLVRMAVSASVRKRDFLRSRQGAGSKREFFVERATSILVPIGLPFVVDSCIRRPSNHDESIRFAVAISAKMKHALQLASRQHNMDFTLGDGFNVRRNRLGERIPGEQNGASMRHISGVNLYIPNTSIAKQIKGNGLLQRAANAGTAALSIDSQTVEFQQVWAESLRQVSTLACDFRFCFAKKQISQPRLPFEMHD